jgi:CubicO group peptidase (beta-lactamase class C family)
VLTLDGDRLCQLDDAMRGYADGNQLPGLVWVVARGEQAHVRFAGHLDLEAGVPVNRDSIFRISSMTKPVTAVAALLLVEDGRSALTSRSMTWCRSWLGGRCSLGPTGR